MDLTQHSSLQVSMPGLERVNAAQTDPWPTDYSSMPLGQLTCWTCARARWQTPLPVGPCPAQTSACPARAPLAGLGLAAWHCLEGLHYTF